MLNIKIEKGFEPLFKDLQSITLTKLCYSIKTIEIYVSFSVSKEYIFSLSSSVKVFAPLLSLPFAIIWL